MLPDIRSSTTSRPSNIMPFGHEQSNYIHPVRPEDFSPCSSDSSVTGLSNSDADCSDDESLHDSPVPSSTLHPHHPYMNGHYGPTRVVADCDFTIEELSDFDDDDMDGRTDVIRPSTIEEAGSERSQLNDAHLDRIVIDDLRDLNVQSPGSDPSSDESDLDNDTVMQNIKAARVQGRQQRMSQGSIGTKRTKSEMGSGSDHEDALNYVNFDDAGSSARRLKRRKGGDRRSLIFMDPPPRIDEVVEPEELEDGETLARELPFYEYTSMVVDSPGSS